MDTGDPGTDTGDPAPYAAALYPPETTHSPLTPFVADRLRDVMDRSTGQDDVFMKVGASGTVSRNYLYCFADAPELAPYDGLQPGLDHFLAGDAEGDTPFDRTTLAAKVGMSAGWAISGSPSPVEQEIAAIDPAFALIAYGANDMQLGTTYRSASYGYADNLLTLVDDLLDQGIVPVVSGTPQRLDRDDAYLWVPTYTAIARGVAQARQVPFLDLHEAYADLTNWGLSGDGLHGNISPDGGCVFDTDNLDYRANTRNLISLQVLNRLHGVVLEGGAAPDSAEVLEGDGSPEAPFRASTSFSHLADTRESPHDDIDVYDCDDADESGPEWWYELTLDETTAIRAMVFDRGEVDIDLHLLDADGDCLERAHQVIETTLAAGTYRFSLDTWVNSSGSEKGGEYLFLLTTCEPDDGDCR